MQLCDMGKIGAGLFLLILMSCSGRAPGLQKGKEVTAEFSDYWFAGKAELSSYRLEQARYGEMRQGEAVLVFVSEDFSSRHHTKAAQNEKNLTRVLKLNFDKKFITGIYPYSMMMTVASPLNREQFPHPIVLSASVMEWCGHAFFQYLLKGKRYEVTSHSYFPNEGNEVQTMKACFF